mgnify:CR=1 FL=1
MARHNGPDMKEYALATDYLVRKLKTSSNPRFAENIDIPPPQLKRKLLPGEALEVKFRPADTYVGFTVITSTVLDSTRLKVVSEVDDVLDKVEMNNPNCKVIGVEPYTVEFPKRVYYGNTFNLILDGCTANEISEVYLYTTRGKLTHRAIVEE